jgi:hypothetical protein
MPTLVSIVKWPQARLALQQFLMLAKAVPQSERIKLFKWSFEVICLNNRPKHRASLKLQFCFCLLQRLFLKDFLERLVPDACFSRNAWFSFWTYSKQQTGKNAHKRLLVTALLTWIYRPIQNCSSNLEWEIVVYLLETIWGVYWRRGEEIDEGKRRKKQEIPRCLKSLNF